MSFIDKDKVELHGHYDEEGRLHELSVRLNADGLTTADVAAAIRMMFHPGDAISASQSRELGATTILRINGTAVASEYPRAGRRQ